MNIWQSLSGVIEVQITSAEPEILMYKLNSCGICLQNVWHVDDLTVHLQLKRSDYKKLLAYAKTAGANVKVLKRNGIYWSIVKLIGRPVLLTGILMLLALTLFLPTRILFITIEGNEQLPTSLILEKAETCGIKFGASRKEVRSEATKNKLLAALPELRWAGVNTHGCVAEITVDERQPAEGNIQSGKIQHVVAAKDGIISELTVLRGVSQCKIGQAVQKGQVLVSGYVDHGISIEGTQAEAEIYGYTGNILYMFALAEGRQRSEIKKTETNYSLLFGKKLINFRKDSGISDTECVRMYEERYLTLPGGFCLPIALVQERIVYYACDPLFVRNTDAFVWMEAVAEQYLCDQMLSGEILKSSTLTELDGGVCRFYGTYRCREIIGRIRSEENLITNEQGS